MVKAAQATCRKVTNGIHQMIRKKKEEEERFIVIIHQLYIGQSGYVNLIMAASVVFLN